MRLTVKDARCTVVYREIQKKSFTPITQVIVVIRHVNKNENNLNRHKHLYLRKNCWKNSGKTIELILLL